MVVGSSGLLIWFVARTFAFSDRKNQSSKCCDKRFDNMAIDNDFNRGLLGDLTAVIETKENDV